MRSCVIVCAGSTVKEYSEKIRYFCSKNITTIGVNNVYEYCSPDIHLWTNYKRYVAYAQNVPYEMVVFGVFGISLFRKLDAGGMPYNRTDIDEIIDDDIDRWRTAGVRAIQYAHDKGFNEIYVVGMDGYTLLYDGCQHCYGEGLTDNNDMKTEKEKDAIVYSQLRRMWSEGIKFEILTPTVFVEFCKEGVL